MKSTQKMYLAARYMRQNVAAEHRLESTSNKVKKQFYLERPLNDVTMGTRIILPCLFSVY